MTNKNYDLLKEALDTHKPLHSIKFFSNELKNFELYDYELDNLTLKNLEIQKITFTKITFKNCSFDNCIFHKNIFKNCTFIDTRFTYTDFYENNLSNSSFNRIIFNNGLIKLTVCQSISIKDSTFSHFDFDQMSFKETQFIHNSLVKGICYFSKISFSCFEENTLEKTVVNNTTFENVPFNSNQILGCTFKKNTFSVCQFSQNSLVKTTALKNKGIDTSILERILSNKGRIESYPTLLFKHPFHALLGISTVLFIPIFIYYQLAINLDYKFFRYIFNQTFSEFYRTDFSNNVLLMFKLTFKQRQLIPILNETIDYRNNNNPKKAIQKLLTAFQCIESNNNNYNLYILIINWILDIETEDEECKKHYKQFIESIPPSQRNSLRLIIIKKNEGRYFPQTAYLIIQEYLLEASNYDEVSTLVFTLNELNNSDLKKDAGIILHSFIKRLIHQHPDKESAYTQLSEFLKQWEN